MSNYEIALELIRLIRMLAQQPGNRVLILNRVSELESDLLRD